MAIVLISKGQKSSATLVPPTSVAPTVPKNTIINNPSVKIVSPLVPVASRDDLIKEHSSNIKDVKKEGEALIPTKPFPSESDYFVPGRAVPQFYLSGKNLTQSPTSHSGRGTKEDPIVFSIASQDVWQYWIHEKVDLRPFEAAAITHNGATSITVRVSYSYNDLTAKTFAFLAISSNSNGLTRPTQIKLGDLTLYVKFV